jgi:putative restriction endonuclease
MPGGDVDTQVRVAMFAHLDWLARLSPDGALTSSAINTFEFHGRQVKLVVQPGIWKPAFLDAALTIRTTFTPVNQRPPYEDDLGADGLIRYKYRGTDPNLSDNRALREAMLQKVPLAYFIGIAPGLYVARYPVWLVVEDPTHCEFAVAVDEDQRQFDFSALAPLQRQYVERLTKQRVHQPVFRTRVLRAYDDRCAMCRLHHPELLEAAHILPDGEPGGDPVVPNGLSLCSIHHAAFDANILGIRPDLAIQVRQDILDEQDGPMLRYGLQALAGERLSPPKERLARPDPERLQARYHRFLTASTGA